MSLAKPKRLLLAAALLATVGTGVFVFRQPKSVSQSADPNPQVSISPSQPVPLHPVVNRIVHDGPDMPYLKFIYLIKELPSNLPQQDIEALITLISSPMPSTFQEGEWGALVNDIEECLTVQNVPNKQVADALIAIFRDESKVQMQRDYALQHIGGFAIYLIHTSQSKIKTSSGIATSTSVGSAMVVTKTDPHVSSSDLQSLLLSELKSAATQTSKPWSGTALNLLDGVLRAAEYRSVEVPGLDADMLVNIAVPIARDAAAPLNARLPALQLAARHDSPAARDLAREILSSPKSGLMLVQCASGALARLGTSEDLPLLQTVSASATRHTAPAINQAIQSIQSRSETH